MSTVENPKLLGYHTLEILSRRKTVQFITYSYSNFRG
jgi:hypothetical protein